MIPNLDITREQIEALCHKWHITELSVFGSVLRDDFHDNSDVDFLVVFEDTAKITLFDLMGLEDDLSALVQRPVDVVTKRSVAEGRNARRRQAILTSHEVVYAA